MEISQVGRQRRSSKGAAHDFEQPCASTEMSNAWAVLVQRHLIGPRALLPSSWAEVRSCWTTSPNTWPWLPPKGPWERGLSTASTSALKRPLQATPLAQGLRSVYHQRFFRLSPSCSKRSDKRASRPPSSSSHVQPKHEIQRERPPDPNAPVAASQANAQTVNETVYNEVLDEDTPLPGGDLTGEQVEKVFGNGIKTDVANHILRVLQYRRVTGRLIDDGLRFPPALRLQENLVFNALAYLREKYPLDEEAAAQAYAEAEAQRLEEKLLADAERIGLYRPEQGLASNPVYGESGLDAIRAHHKAEWDEIEATEEEQRKSQADEVRDNAGPLVTARRYAELRRSEKSDWLKYYEEQAVIVKDKVAPQMTKWARLWPSALITMITISLCAAFAYAYTPPTRSARLWPDTPPAAATIISLLIINSTVLLLWRIPPAWRFLNKYFLQVPGYPTAFSVLGNIFSHQQLSHFGANMLVLWLVGTRLHEEIGRGNFLAIYIAGGAFGSFASLFAFVMRNNFVTTSLGASGAIAAIFAAWCAINSERTFSFIFLPEGFPAVSPKLVLLAAVGIELYGVRRGWGKVDHYAHLGGYAAGFVGAQMIKSRVEERKRQERERISRLSLIERIKEGHP